MNFRPTPSQAKLTQAARDYATTALSPQAAAFEVAEDIPASVFEDLAERGLMSVTGDRAWGGSAASTVAYAMAMMEIGQGCAATAVTMAVTNMVGEVIKTFGSPEQIEAYCPRLAAGKLGAFGLSEAGAGSDPGAMLTTATLDEEGWLLQGTKQWISHGDRSAVVVVWARTDGQGSRGLSCFLVDPNAPGFNVTNHEDKMGLRASHTVGLEFDALRLPANALLGERGAGFRIAMMALDGGRIGVGSQAIGIGESAFADALSYVIEANLGGDQGVQWRIADMRTRLDAARLLALRAASQKDAGVSFSLAASMAKAFATESAWQVCNEAVALMGSAGLERGRAAERALRDVRVTMIYEGTSEIQRVVISRMLLS